MAALSIYQYNNNNNNNNNNSDIVKDLRLKNKDMDLWSALVVSCHDMIWYDLIWWSEDRIRTRGQGLSSRTTLNNNNDDDDDEYDDVILCTDIAVVIICWWLVFSPQFVVTVFLLHFYLLIHRFLNILMHNNSHVCTVIKEFWFIILCLSCS